MNEINTLLTQYSAGEIVLFLIIALFALKALNELLGYFWNKIKQYFNVENEKENWQLTVTNSLTEIQDDLKVLHDQNHQTHQHQKEMDNEINLIQERMQENTRSYLIDAHHKFCYEIGAIDDLSLQAMERRYLYYKTAGGDTFVDKLMDEARTLPRINSYTGTIDENKNAIDDRKEN